jgi:transcriptional regulator with XRE-family HTH domain
MYKDSYTGVTGVRGGTQRLAEMFNVSSQTVRSAVLERTNSELAKQIREQAAKLEDVEDTIIPNIKVAAKTCVAYGIVRVRGVYGTTRKLAKMFGVSEQTVSMSLHGKRNGARAKAIRMAAVEMGGDPIYN